ncbi:hypothetical protein [Winogradskyella sp. UBA3174]|nr:hypothetical protein [Winogradskyella sp. UBA3174]|tara:strand:+ start:132268 stop:132408 length:141 start_codon:yes stop_codon:yes gene_type:complete
MSKSFLDSLLEDSIVYEDIGKEQFVNKIKLTSLKSEGDTELFFALF